MRFKKVGIILKKGSSEPQRIGNELVAWFARKSITATIDNITPDLDCLVILGGDGTLLHVASQAGLLGIPVVGINLGGLGFLTEIGADEWRETMEAVLSGSVTIEERMMIKTRLVSERGTVPWRYVLNDVVISKGNADQLVRLNTWADDEYITTYKADGIIFSTPTGSTAYNLSAGGPVVQPELNAILVTPICPFMLESRPVLLPPEVKLKTRPVGPINDVKVITDGQTAWDMQEDDLLEVQTADRPLRLISSPRKGYFEILRNKLNWGGGQDIKT